jgi:hypothetical protein
MNQVGDALEAAGFTPNDVTKLRDPDILTQLKLVLMGLAAIVRHSFKLECTQPFWPDEFLEHGWSVWRGPAYGNGLSGKEKRDKRADALDFVDWDHVLLETHLQGGEASVGGEEKLRRANASGNIQLGVNQFFSLWNDYKQNGKDSVLERLRFKGVERIYFFGTIMRGPNGHRYVLYLFLGGSRWLYGSSLLDCKWRAFSPSASIESVK